MTHIHHATEGAVWKAITEATQAIYLAEESTAKAIADGSKQQTKISQNFIHEAEQDVTKAINSFNSYEAAVKAAHHSSFWGSVFGWVLTIAAVIASAFAGPEILAMTVLMIVASKSGLTSKMQDGLAKALGGSKLLAGVLMTAALVAVGAGAGATAGMVTEDAGSVASEEVSSVASKDSESLASRIKTKIKTKVASLSRKTAGGINALGQGLQNFNVGSDIAQAMSHSSAFDKVLGNVLEVLVDLVAIISQGVGTGNSMMRAGKAGQGLCGSSLAVNNVALFKAVGALTVASTLGEGACSIATGALEEKQSNSILAYTNAQAHTEFLDNMKEMSHTGFSTWIESEKSVMKALSEQANASGQSISAVTTQLAIAMSSRG